MEDRVQGGHAGQADRHPGRQRLTGQVRPKYDYQAEVNEGRIRVGFAYQTGRATRSPPAKPSSVTADRYWFITKATLVAARAAHRPRAAQADLGGRRLLGGHAPETLSDSGT